MHRSLLWIAALGCTPKPAAGPWDEGVFLPAEPTESGDPDLGREHLLSGDYMTCGIPYALWAFADDSVAQGLGGSAGAPRLEGRLGANADMPYSINVFDTPEGVEVVSNNCFSCHGGMADGQLVEGLGNATADWTFDASETSEAIPPESLAALGLTDGEIAAFEKISGRVAAITDFTVMRTIGNNPAEGLAVALMVHHDRDTLAWSDTPLTPIDLVDAAGQPISEAVVTSDPPPWWRVKKKHALFYNGMARGDHRGTMALATSLCVDTVERALEVDEQFRHIHAYVKTITAPVYPHAIDRDLAADGAEVFDDACAGCHGTYDDDPRNDDADTYPNLLLPLSVVGTDPVVANAGVVHAPAMVDWYNNSFYGEITRLEPDEPFVGYMPPPLDGIWATAPFFHNGSVPTLEGVLDRGRRPAVWRRVDLDSTTFDQDAVGWPYEELSVPQAELPLDEQPMVYDTSHWSQSNAGHPFADALTDDERRAVIEYLKTL